VAIPNVSPQTYVMARCARWGTYVRWLSWTRIAPSKPKSVVSWWGKLVLDGNIEQLMMAREAAPVSIPEAIETGNCVMALPAHLRDAVVEEYAVRGKQSEKAEALGIDTDTLRRRLETAYPLLLELFNCAAASLPLECNYRGPGRPRKETSDDGAADNVAETTGERETKKDDGSGARIPQKGEEEQAPDSDAKGQRSHLERAG
jgi:hypothetical protein